MVNIKTLLYARLATLVCSVGVTAAVVGLSAIALKDLHHKRDLLAERIKGGIIHADDVLGVCGALCAAAVIGVIVSLITLFLFFREKRGLVSNGLRVGGEMLLGLAALFLLAVSIAATIIVGSRSAWAESSSLGAKALAAILKATGSSLAYRETKAFPAMICGWICFGLLLLDLCLTIAAGLHYRRVAREGHAGVAHHDDVKGTHDAHHSPAVQQNAPIV